MNLALGGVVVDVLDARITGLGLAVLLVPVLRRQKREHRRGSAPTLVLSAAVRS